MHYLKIFVFYLFVLSLHCNGQDSLFTKNNKIFAAKIIEIDEAFVKYKLYSDTSNQLLKINRRQMIKIKYSTDSIQWFVTPPPKVVLKNNLNTTALKSKLSDSSTISNPTLITQNIINYDSIAAIDSKNYYKHDLGASATGIAALILTPLGGLILAIPTSMMPPNKENLGKLRFPENNNYMRNYEKQAFKIKRKRVWKAYAIGSAINIIFISGILALKFL